MAHEVPVFWHHAVSLLHRDVALASFLRTAVDAHLDIYFAVHDAATATIVVIAALLEIVATAWDGRSYPPAARPWVWIQSHAPTGMHPHPGSETLHAVFCLGPPALDEGMPPHILRDHRPFITGMPWSSTSAACCSARRE